MSGLDPKTLWQDQPVENRTMPLNEVKRRARWSSRIIALRNGLDYLACIFVSLWLAYAAVYYFDTLPLRIACVVSVGLCALTGYLVWRRAGRLQPPAEDSATAYLQHQRAQLVRQIQAARTAWLWYLGPLMGVMLTFMIALPFVELSRRVYLAVAVYFVVGAVTSVATIAINIFRAARMERLLKDFEDPS